MARYAIESRTSGHPAERRQPQRRQTMDTTTTTTPAERL